MIGKAAMVVVAAGLLAACEPSAPARPKAPEAPPAYRTAVVSTGAPILNEEFGISAVFPVGARVCEALSGEHPQGLYTRLGDARFACIPSGDPPRVSSMAVLASYNAAFYRTVEEVIGPDCPAPRPGEPLGLPGLDTTVCEMRLPNGDIRISFNALAGAWDEEPGKTAPYLIYSAYLVTNTTTEAADRATFRRFLDQLRLTPPSAASGGAT